MAFPVPHTKELARILALPRRCLSDHDTDKLVELLTARFKTPEGTQTLRPIQAQALAEIITHRCLFGGIRVGEGKTLISLLAPTALQSLRPVLVLPASLIEKTKQEQRAYSKHWRIPRFLRMVSYTAIGLERNDGLLERYKADAVICDEMHKLRNLRDASRAKKFRRWRAANPAVPVVMMSGSPFDKSLKDAAHLLAWTHGNMSPLPLEWGVLEDWCNVVDDGVSDCMSPGALHALVGPDDLNRGFGHNEQQITRSAIGRRILDTPGVVCTTSAPLDVPLTLNAVGYPLNAEVQAAVHEVRSTATTPDGWMLFEQFEVSRFIRALAVGMYYRWDPFPPEDWYTARKMLTAALRDVLSGSRLYDNPTAVFQAVDAGKLAMPELAVWREIQPSFEPNSKAVWLDDTPLHFAADWMARKGGMVWTMHQAFARRLQEITGAPYYGAEGLCSRTGRPVAQHPGDRPAISSIHANRQGQNLHQINTALMMSTPSSGEWAQQLLGRHHRTKQTRPVTWDVVQVCLEQVRALETAGARHDFAEELLRDKLKLREACLNVIALEQAGKFTGPLWG